MSLGSLSRIFNNRFSKHDPHRKFFDFHFEMCPLEHFVALEFSFQLVYDQSIFGRRIPDKCYSKCFLEQLFAKVLEFSSEICVQNRPVSYKKAFIPIERKFQAEQNFQKDSLMLKIPRMLRMKKIINKNRNNPLIFRDH